MHAITGTQSTLPHFECEMFLGAVIGSPRIVDPTRPQFQLPKKGKEGIDGNGHCEGDGNHCRHFHQATTPRQSRTN